MANSQPRRGPMFRVSLRELLLYVALVAMAIASLKYASDVWLSLVVGAIMTALFASAVVAIVDRGPRQAFAIGFVLTMLLDFAVVLTGLRTGPGASGATKLRNIEFDPWEGRLPTTRLLRYLHGAVESGYYVELRTGKALPNYDPATDPNRSAGGFVGGGFGPAVSYLEVPSREVFMPIGHCWWMLLLGYAGGHFARFVYWRRFREEQKLPADTS